MPYNPCDWYIGAKRGSPLDKFIEERSLGLPTIYCENDSQTVIVNYIQCVKLNDIEKRDPWAPARVETVKKWATPDNLRRLRYRQDEETGKRIIPHDEFHNMPMLSRKYNLSGNQEKYKITDGIHRINRARELGIDCILSSVEEYLNISKNDKDNVDQLG